MNISIEEILIFSLLHINIKEIKEVELIYNFKNGDCISIKGKDINRLETILKSNGNYIRQDKDIIIARVYFPFKNDLKLIKEGKYSKTSKIFKKYCINNSSTNRDVLRKLFNPKKEDIIKELMKKLDYLSKDKRRKEAFILFKEFEENNVTFELYKPLIKNK